MAINPEIRDQAYQFFVEEAPELLQTIEAELLTLHQERDTAQVHNLMRSAHSIKGGAASVGLEPIAALAHRLENIFKALYSDTLTIDVELEAQLFRAYDCLRLPLMEQITTGSFDAAQALAIAEPVFSQIETACGEALLQSETYIPSSSDLGVDMVTSIFEVDVAQGLDRLTAVLTHPQAYEVAGELRAQVEVFAGFAELLNLSGFGTIADAVQQALSTHPDRALEITQLAVADFAAYRQAILTGDRSGAGAPSAALLALTDPASLTATSADIAAASALNSELEAPFSLFEDLESIFGGAAAMPEVVAATDLETEVTAAEAGSDEPDEDAIAAALSQFANQAFWSEPEQAANIDSESILNHPIAPVAHDITTAQIAVEETLAQTDANQMTEALMPETIDAEWVAAPTFEPQATVPSAQLGGAIQLSQPTELYYPQTRSRWQSDSVPSSQKENSFSPTPALPNLTVRVDSSRLEKMNNLVGELAINRDALSLQNEQMQSVVRDLLTRFARFQTMVGQLRELSDQMLVSPERYSYTTSGNGNGTRDQAVPLAAAYRSIASGTATAEFDPLEMDSYGTLYLQLQEILENLVQLEETVDDVSLFARQSNQMLDQQRNRLSQLQDELIWARMLPLGEVLNRFPRMLRDLSIAYRKPVQLKLTGTSVLVEKAILEKLYDPLLHLLRNAFDHGIEPAERRRQQGKPEQGQIEIRAYHKGNQTIIEISDDGQGLNLERIRDRIFKLGWLSSQQLAVLAPAHLFEFIFEPGFSTADRVSELSGRGVGLDVVRSQLRAVKGTVSVTSSPGQGTTFTLRLPLTLTITKLIICLVNSSAIALPADCVEEILTPEAGQIQQSGAQRFLYWREQIIPAYRLGDLLDYACPQSEMPISKALVTVPSPEDWALPMLILQQEQQIFALEVDRLVTEQELVIKPFGAAIAPPSYTYGCTILGDGSLVPVIDGAALIGFTLERAKAAIQPQGYRTALPTMLKAVQAPTILVVDDAVTLRRTLALSLERMGFRVLQARDGREAIAQLQKNPAVKLVVCDVEMPNMNGFEFLSYRRQEPNLSSIPIVMLTSRSNEKHRWLALQLGATAYFTKPYLEQEFLAALEKILNL
jgi:chemotaxis family two-component system sensor histidine kinase/response regulator PixL